MKAAEGRLNLPNLITLFRIAACPVVFMLALSMGVTARLVAFALFVVASASDLWDGYLARKHGQITALGKLLDPLADKLLLASTFIPFYIISHRAGAGWELPWWGALPVWVLVVIFGRELGMTVFRTWAARRGEIIAAQPAGKYKAFIQNLFSGGVLLWYPLLALAQEGGWGGTWDLWRGFHEIWIGVMLLAALVLTVYSMFDYLWSYRSLFGGATKATKG